VDEELPASSIPKYNEDAWSSRNRKETVTGNGDSLDLLTYSDYSKFHSDLQILVGVPDA
jgi:hypothetical protein